MINYLVATIYIGLIIIIFIINNMQKRRWLSINFIYTILWSFTGIFSMFNNLNLLKPRIDIHIFIVLSVIIFNIVYYVFSNDKNNEIEITKFDKLFNYKVIVIINIIGLICIMPNTIKAIGVILERGLDLTYIRSYIYMGSANFFTKNIPNAIVSATSIIAAIELVTSKKKRVLFLSIIGVISTTITYGGRYTILNFLVYIIAAYVILGKKIEIKIKKKYIIIPIVLLFMVTMLRTKEVSTFFDSIIRYFVGSVSFLEYILQNEVEYGITYSYKLGYMSFAFIIEPIIYVVKVFGSGIKIPSYYFNIHAQEFVNIGETYCQMYNNNTTYFYNFLLDFGYFGFIMAPLILASIVVIVEKCFYRKKGLLSLALLIYMYSVIVNSSMMYTLGSISSSLVIIFLIVFCKTKKGEKNDRKIAQV